MGGPLLSLVRNADNVQRNSGMRMVVSLALNTDLDGLQPLVLERFVDGPPRLWVRVKHVLDDVPALTGNQVVQRRGASGGAFRPGT